MRENLLDELAHQLIDTVRAQGSRRVFIDGLGGFQRAAVDSSRLVEFFTTLANQLRAAQTTTVATMETRELLGPSVIEPLPELSSIVDNLVLLRQREHEGQTKRGVSIVKVRDSMFESAMREVVIGSGGLCVKNSNDLGNLEQHEELPRPVQPNGN